MPGSQPGVLTPSPQPPLRFKRLLIIRLIDYKCQREKEKLTISDEL